jgi:hypothetical protein
MASSAMTLPVNSSMTILMSGFAGAGVFMAVAFRWLLRNCQFSGCVTATYLLAVASVPAQ